VQDKRTTHCLTAGATSKADGSVNQALFKKELEQKKRLLNPKG